MMRIFLSFALFALLVAFVGCGSKHYTITKTDGTSVVSVGEPKYSKDSETYKFENLDGQEMILKRENVKDIVKNKN